MKQFDKKVRWEFQVCVHGYGENVKDALMDAAQRLINQCENEFHETDFDAIEEHEVVDIIKDDILEE